jgi:hypothetical protein
MDSSVPTAVNNPSGETMKAEAHGWSGSIVYTRPFMKAVEFSGVFEDGEADMLREPLS